MSPGRSVHNGVKLRCQMHLLCSAVELEVGGIRSPVDGDVVQLSPEVSKRREDARNPVEDGKISVVEGITAREPGAGWLIEVPRAEASGAVNHSRRRIVRQVRLVVHRLA